MATGITELGLAYESDYAKTMNETVLPWLKAHCSPEIVNGAGGKPVMTFRYDAEKPRGTVTIIHGFTECAEKFSELSYSLIQNGYSVLTCDQRGHGASWRDEGISDLSLTHVEHFQDYVDDLLAIVNQRLKKMPKPWYIFCHSMGGAVTVAFLEDHPGIFEKAVFCAPMIAPQRGGMPLWTVKTLCRVEKLIGKGKSRVFISKPWAGPEKFEESCASGRARFDWWDAKRVENRKYQNNGPTYSWTLEAMNVTKRLLAPGKPEGIQIPALLYTAESDNQVFPEQQATFAERAPNCRRKTVAGAKHEIYRSTDAVFFPWWQEILEFYGK